MMLAILTWTMGVVTLLTLLRLFLKRGNIAAVAVLFILLPQVFTRPVLFFLGLDAPFPYEYFDGPDWNLIATGLLVAVTWILIFSGTHLAMQRPLIPLGRLLPQVSARMDVRILLLATAMTTLLGVALTGGLIQESGSLEKFMFNVKIGKEMTGAYIIRQVSVIGAIFAVLAILYYEKRYRSSGRHRDRTFVWLCAGLFLVNLTFNYFWGNRYNIAMLVFALGLAWHYHIQRIPLRHIILMIVITAVLLQGLKMFRNTAVEEVLGREIVRDQTFWTDISTSLHLNQFDAFILALRDAGERFTFRDGRDFINGLLAWVPRAFYPDKETFHVGQWFRQVYEPNVVNGWPITTMGSWYVNFGFLGIILGGIVSGIIAAWFDAGYRAVRNSFWQAAVAPAMAFLMFDGGVGTGFLQDVFLVLVPVYMLAVALRVLERKQSKALERKVLLRSSSVGPRLSH